MREKLPVLVKTLERISPRALIYEGSFAERVAQIRAQVPLITGFVRARSEATPADQIRSGDEPVIPDDLDRYPLDFEPMALAGNDLAAIVLTSGTTGIPKGVLHTHARLVESCRAAVYPFGLTPHSSTLKRPSWAGRTSPCPTSTSAPGRCSMTTGTPSACSRPLPRSA
ncbi:AMP-binding protein [Immundisolibacter sp.]